MKAFLHVAPGRGGTGRDPHRAGTRRGETGRALHIVHVSSPEGVELIAEARAQRVDATAETCPHYLLLNDKDVVRLGATAKCTPPIRDEKRRGALWQELRAGNIQTVGSITRRPRRR